jgi:uncharacterized protein
MSRPGKSSGTGLGAGILFGLIFGFLLQKGGVANYNVLVGQLLLEDFTVVKVMMSAVVVGMLGVFVMHRYLGVELHLKPTRLGAQSIGGLLFGAGFALGAYCPGTGAAAIGQGSWDALLVVVGLVGGSYLYALSSDRLSRTVESWGDLGEKTLWGVLKMPPLPTALGAAALITGILAAIHFLIPGR